MRLYEFIILLEYNRDITKQKLGDKILSVSIQQDRITDLDQALESLESMDPTRNKKYTDWIIKRYLNREFDFSHREHVRELLSTFDRIKPGLPADQRDLGRYTFQQLIDVTSASPDAEKLSKVDRYLSGIDPSEVNILYKGPLGLLVSPLTIHASRRLGRETNWCTAYNNEHCKFDNYTKSAPLYIWVDISGEKYQFYFNGDIELMDKRNDPIDPAIFNKFRTSHPILSKFFRDQEKKISEDPEISYNYALNTIKRPFPPGESAIATNSKYSYMYAKNIIRGPWPPGEPAIATNANYSFKYALDMIRGPWSPGESAIATDAEQSYMYAKNIIRGPWPPGEPAIATNAKYSAKYALDMIRGPWPPGESAIADDAEQSYMYANNIIRGPWPPGEPAIATNAKYSAKYALDMIRGPWPPGESAIATDAEQSYMYSRYVIKGAWPPGEPAIAKKGNYASFYAENVIKGPFLLGEPAISQYADLSFSYSTEVIKGPWAPGEAAIMSDPLYKRYYRQFLDTIQSK